MMTLELTEERLNRYERQISLPEIGKEGQKKLLASSVLVIGLGGVGGVSALYLCAAGVGKIGLVDADKVDLSNLQRQIIYSVNDIGAPKVDSAKKRLNALNPETAVVVHNLPVTIGNAADIIKDYGIILDCSDNFSTKYLINDICVRLRKPFVHSGVSGFRGEILTVLPPEGPCYRCLFPEEPPDGLFACQGVVGTTAGITAAIQANEAIKYLLGIGGVLSGRLLVFDGQRGFFRSRDFKKRSDCPICGTNPALSQKERGLFDDTGD